MIDITKQGYESVGVYLSEQQFDLLNILNVAMLCPERQSIPVFNIVILLKILNVLPPDMASQLPAEADFDDYNDYIQAMFGRKRE